MCLSLFQNQQWASVYKALLTGPLIMELGREMCCLLNRSVRADTRMGPEGTKLKQKPEPGLKSL